MKKTGNIWLGVILGVVIPFFIVGLINLGLFIFDKNFPTEVFQASLLLGVGINAILIRVFFKRNKDFTSRGIMISSMLIFIYWVIMFVLIGK
jgi:hypothetical protein